MGLDARAGHDVPVAHGFCTTRCARASRSCGSCSARTSSATACAIASIRATGGGSDGAARARVPLADVARAISCARSRQRRDVAGDRDALDGELVAVPGVCPHEDVELADGDLHGASSLPRHGYEFDLRTGRCMHDPDARAAPLSRDASSTTKSGSTCSSPSVVEIRVGAAVEPAHRIEKPSIARLGNHDEERLAVALDEPGAPHVAAAASSAISLMSTYFASVSAGVPRDRRQAAMPRAGHRHQIDDPHVAPLCISSSEHAPIGLPRSRITYDGSLCDGASRNRHV